jgi:hypothetical protein
MMPGAFYDEDGDEMMIEAHPNDEQRGSPATETLFINSVRPIAQVIIAHPNNPKSPSRDAITLEAWLSTILPRETLIPLAVMLADRVNNIQREDRRMREQQAKRFEFIRKLQEVAELEEAESIAVTTEDSHEPEDPSPRRKRRVKKDPETPGDDNS